MFKSSRCSVVFPINGMALSSDITFQPGITAVVGRNGTGKTFKTIELWRYLLFGKKALRGPASDYKKLEAEGVVEIKGVEYLIKRTPKSEGLYQGDDQLAVGADAVNKKVIELLGFGLDVFDICNASVQKQSNKLTQLPPAKRKELIDEVCGLAKNEKAEKDCKEKAKLLKLEADTIRENTAPVTEPVKPQGYEPAAAIKTKLDDARSIERERHALKQITEKAYPFRSPPDEARMNVEALETSENERRFLETTIEGLRRRLEAIPTTTYTAEQVKNGQAWVQYDNEVARRGPKPEISEEEANDALSAYDRIAVLQSINTEVECPKCENRFTPARELPEQPEKPEAYYRQQRERLSRWSSPLAEPKGKRIPKDELEAAHTAIVRADERAKVSDDLKLLESSPIPDRSAELEEAKRIDTEWERYNAYADQLNALLKEQSEATDKMAKLPPEVDIAALDAAFVAARIYEDQLERHKRDSADYLEKMTKVRDLVEEAAGYTKGAQRLIEARREAKAYLAPSLSRIASALITEMTCGKLTDVVIDDDMNITVNGQDACTLSGAGETAANLAVRLALGKVLVGGVFPVFLGDEIDADADEERSEATFECLRNLRNQFSQVIIITHKPHVTADHMLDFDE